MLGMPSAVISTAGSSNRMVTPVASCGPAGRCRDEQSPDSPSAAERTELVEAAGAGDRLTVGVVDDGFEREVGLALLGCFGLDPRNRLVIERGLGAEFGPRHADELDVDGLYQREVLGGVEGAQRDDAAEDFGDA